MAKGRRAEHSREELVDLIIEEGVALMADEGFAGFSARKLAARIGYSVSMVLHVMGGPTQIVMAVNTRTFELWADRIQQALEGHEDDRLEVLVQSYFRFAAKFPKLWMAIYEHHLPGGIAIPPDQQERRGRLTGIIIAEVARALPADRRSEAPSLARSLIATVHGHCHLWLCGAMELMGEEDPMRPAMDRVRDAMGGAR